MCLYFGNSGHLLQHWVLCEILGTAAENGEEVAFVDGHSMAPLATHRKKKDLTFDRVLERLPGEGSRYERTWRLLSPCGAGYPNSAAFVVQLWPGRYSLLLCEKDPTTARRLRTWAEGLRPSPRCAGIEISEGDWRSRFQRGVTLSGDTAFFSFDPYKFDCQRAPDCANPGNMYPDDLETLAAATQSVHQGVVVQLSTYSASGANSQERVIEVVRSCLKPSGFELIAAVHLDGNMMSMVLVRNVIWADRLRSLAPRFGSWLERASRLGSVGHAEGAAPQPSAASHIGSRQMDLFGPDSELRSGRLALHHEGRPTDKT